MTNVINRVMNNDVAFFGAEPSDEEVAAAKEAEVAAAKAAEEAAAAKAADELAATKAAEKKAADDKALADLKDDPEKAKLLKESMKRKEKIAELESKLEESSTNLKRFDGIDPDEVMKRLQERKDAEKKELENKGDFERLKKMMADEHSTELKKIQDALEAAKEEVNSSNSKIDDLTIGNQFNGSKFITEELVLTPAKTRIIYGSHFSMEDGVMVGFDKPAGKADRTKLVDGSGNALGFEAAIQKLVEADPDNETIRRSKVKPGSNSNPDDVPGNKPESNSGESSGKSIIAAALEKQLKAK